MDLIKLYLSQSITTAANNLRLNSQQIEIISLLKEALFKSEKTENVIRKMKKITELSTLAIKLDEIYHQLQQGQIDLSKLSDRFKLHSQNLVKDLFILLNNSNLYNLKIVFEKIKNDGRKKVELKQDENIIVEENKSESVEPDKTETKEVEKVEETKEARDEKEEEILHNDNTITEPQSFESFEKSILEPIKTLDAVLKHLSESNQAPEDFIKYSEIMDTNSQLSEKKGFEILAGLHSVISDSVKLIISGKLQPEKETVESMRACLIVIAAIIRGKEVDITFYLNKAEQFGSKIKFLKMKKEN